MSYSKKPNDNGFRIHHDPQAVEQVDPQAVEQVDPQAVEQVDSIAREFQGEIEGLKSLDKILIENNFTQSFDSWDELLSKYYFAGPRKKCLYLDGKFSSIDGEPIYKIHFNLILNGLSVILNKSRDEVSILDFCSIDPWKMVSLMKLPVFEFRGDVYSLGHLVVDGLHCNFKKITDNSLNRFRRKILIKAVEGAYGDDVYQQVLSVSEDLNMLVHNGRLKSGVEELSPSKVYNILLEFVAQTFGKSFEDTSFVDFLNLTQEDWSKFYFNCKGFFVTYNDLASRLNFRQHVWKKSKNIHSFQLTMLTRALMNEDFLNLKSELKSRVYAGCFELVSNTAAKELAYKICFGENLSSVIIQDTSSDFQDKLIQSISEALLGEHGSLAMQEADSLLGKNVLAESTTSAISEFVLSNSQSMEDLTYVLDAYDENLDPKVIELVLSRDEFDQDQRDVFFNVLDEFYGDIDLAEEITRSFVDRILNGEFGEFLKEQVLDLYEKDQLGDAAMLAVENSK